MNKKLKSLLIITPVYNEEEIIINCINETYHNAKNYFNHIKYVVVNDGSLDNSLQLIKHNYENHKDFKIIDKDNGGIGSAFRAGLKKNKMEYVICIPADSPLDADTAKAFFNSNLKDNDIIVGYRLERKGYSLRMKINSIVYHFLISFIFRMKLKDYNWIHLYKSSIFDKVEVKSDGLFMLAEILIQARNNNFSFKEVPVQQRERLTGIATAAKISSILKTIKEMLRFYQKGK